MGGIKRIGNTIVISLSEIDSNIYLLGDTVIDSGTGFNFTRLYQVFKMLNFEIKDVKRIVNTHGHFDHIGGNGYFISADIAIHDADAGIVEKGDVKLSYADYYDGRLRPRKVSVRLRDGDTVCASDMELKVIHTPGHTRGSICLYDSKSCTLFSGDTVFSDGIGRTDMPGGDESQLRRSLEILSSLPVRRLFPGHGESLVLDKAKPLGEIIHSSTPPGDDDDV